MQRARPLISLSRTFSDTKIKSSIPAFVRSSSFSTTDASTSEPSLSSPSVALHQYAICPFCNKAKALLAYAGLSYDAIEVNPLTKTELKHLQDQSYRKVPIAVIDGQQINGSDAIVTALLDHTDFQPFLENRWEAAGDKGMTMDKFRLSDSATRWSRFAHDDLAALMYPNLCNTLVHSYQAFSYVDGVHAFSKGQKIMIKGIGSVAMYLAASKIKSKRGISDEKEALARAVAIWEEEGLGRGAKHFGSGLGQPDLGDITVYGTLRSVEGLPAHDLAVESSPVVRDWYQRMRQEMAEHG